jgi:enamine deaminase RidA (YjgF/YER057c/UK114 family)
MTSPHQMINPGGLPRAVGFTHVVVAQAGRAVYLAGQTGHRADGSIAPDLLGQFAQACRNVAAALAEVGGRPEHLASMQILVTDLDAYRRSLKPLGELYRERFNRHYPATSLFGVTGLLDSAALVELVCVAVIPVSSPRSEATCFSPQRTE